MNQRLMTILTMPGLVKIGSLKKITAAAIIMLAAVLAASAATFTVTSTADSGAGSLRQAVLNANAAPYVADTIVFDIPPSSCNATTGVCTITLASEIHISGAVTINGTGANRLTIDGGPGTNRIFYIYGFTFILSNVTLTGGNGGGSLEDHGGGAILAQDVWTIYRGVNFTANSTTTSFGEGGAIYNLGGGHIIENCVFSGNISANANGGAVASSTSYDSSIGNLTIVNSTFTDNYAYNYGGAVNVVGNSAISLALQNNTISANHATFGAGIRFSSNSGTFTFKNNIIAGNIVLGPRYPEILLQWGSTATSNGYNIIGDSAGEAANTLESVTYQSTDILDTPPLLDPLANYGGTVPTMRLQPGSPAIDKGNSFGSTMDQRLFPRPMDLPSIANAAGGDGADIGAYEVFPVSTLGWGYNPNGAVGDGTINTLRPSPTDLTGGFDDIVSFESGYYHALGLRSNGTLLSWGLNDNGQLGRTAADSAEAATPNFVTGTSGSGTLSGVVAATGGEHHSLAILADGTVAAWGLDSSGQLGDGTTGSPASRQTPGLVKTNAAGTTNLTNVIAVAAGTSSSIALRSDGTVWTWGNDFYGQLGDGATDSTRAFAAQVPNLSNVVAIDAGGSHCLALLADGSVRAWGFNFDGQVGTLQGSNQFTPVTPAGLNAGAAVKVTQIAAGFRHSVALRTDGSVLTWGDNFFGQVGNGTSGSSSSVPTASGISQVTDVKSSLGYVTYARRRDGSIFAWGYNNDGQIGDGTTNTTGCKCQPTPTLVPVGAGMAVFGAAGITGFAASPLAPVSTGANQFVRLGDATVNFSNVTATGTINISAFDPSTTGLTIPAGYTILANSNGYHIASSAQFTGNAQVCLKVPNVIDQTVFNTLTILHDDNFDGTLDAPAVTTKNYQKREVCRVTQSFSPFVLAQALAPTSATVSVGGRVMVDKGTGLRGATVTLTDMNGNFRVAISSSFGYYRFDDVEVGEIYFISVRSKRYFFETQIINPTEDVGELNFFAETTFDGLKGR